MMRKWMVALESPKMNMTERYMTKLIDHRVIPHTDVYQLLTQGNIQYDFYTIGASV